MFDAIRWPGMKSAVISLDFKSSREPEEAFNALLDPAWGVEYRSSERSFLFPHGHEVVFRSEKAINSIRGPRLKTLVMDEAAYQKYSSFLAAIGCGMASENFRLYLPTTPKRESQWVREVEETWGKQSGSRIVRLRTMDNPFRNQAFIEWIRRNTPADVVEQELEGKVVPPQHAVYNVFRRSETDGAPANVRPEPEIGAVDITREFTEREFGVEANLLIGWDFGHEAVVICRVYRESFEVRDFTGRRQVEKVETLYVVGEEVDDGRTTTAHHARRVAQRWGTSAVVITDAMGAHDRAIQGQNTAAIKLLKEAGFLRVIPVADADPAIKQRLETVNVFICDGAGRRRLFLVPGKCPRLLDTMENHEMGPDGKPKKDGKEHVGDALGYLVYKCFPIGSGMPADFKRGFGARS
jgi:hypothetical protein